MIACARQWNISFILRVPQIVCRFSKRITYLGDMLLTILIQETGSHHRFVHNGNNEKCFNFCYHNLSWLENICGLTVRLSYLTQEILTLVKNFILFNFVFRSTTPGCFQSFAAKCYKTVQFLFRRLGFKNNKHKKGTRTYLQPKRKVYVKQKKG